MLLLEISCAWFKIIYKYNIYIYIFFSFLCFWSLNPPPRSISSLVPFASQNFFFLVNYRSHLSFSFLPTIVAFFGIIPCFTSLLAFNLQEVKQGIKIFIVKVLLSKFHNWAIVSTNHRGSTAPTPIVI